MILDPEETGTILTVGRQINDEFMISERDCRVEEFQRQSAFRSRGYTAS